MIKVNNTYPGSDLASVTAQTDDPDQIYRNTNNTQFIPTRIIATCAGNASRLQLVDADLTDAGEFAYKDETYLKLDIPIAANAVVVLTQAQLPENLQFRYGVAGYSSAGTAIEVFIEGEEHFLTTTE